jgi:hypothetical protein
MTGLGVDLFPESLFAGNRNLRLLDFSFLACSSKPPCRLVLPKIAKNLTSLEVKNWRQFISSTWGQCYKTFSVRNFPNKLVFVPGRPFQHSLLFMGKARTQQ